MPSAQASTSRPSSPARPATAEPRRARRRAGWPPSGAVRGEAPQDDVGVGDGRAARRPGRRRPGRAARPAECGPTRSAPPESAQATLPAAGRDRRHVEHRQVQRVPGDHRPGRPRRGAVADERDVAGGAAHVEGQGQRAVLAARPARAAPTTPPAGPLRTVQAAWSRQASIGSTPPLDCMIAGAGSPASAARPASRSQVGAQHGGQVGVDGGRREALVLADLGEHLAGGADVHAGQRRAQGLGHPPLVGGVGEREQQPHRHRLGRRRRAPPRPRARATPRRAARARPSGPHRSRTSCVRSCGTSGGGWWASRR